MSQSLEAEVSSSTVANFVGTEEILSSVGESKDSFFVIVNISKFEERSMDDTTVSIQVVAVNSLKNHEACWKSKDFISSVSMVLNIVNVSSNSIRVLCKFPLVVNLLDVGLVVGCVDMVGGVLSNVVVGSSSKVHEKSWH